MLNVIFMPDLFSLRIFKIIVNNLHRKYIHLLPSQYNFSDFIFITDLLASLVCKTNRYVSGHLANMVYSLFMV